TEGDQHMAVPPNGGLGSLYATQRRPCPTRGIERAFPVESGGQNEVRDWWPDGARWGDVQRVRAAGVAVVVAAVGAAGGGVRPLAGGVGPRRCQPAGGVGAT